MLLADLEFRVLPILPEDLKVTFDKMVKKGTADVQLLQEFAQGTKEVAVNWDNSDQAVALKDMISLIEGFESTDKKVFHDALEAANPELTTYLELAHH